ncbi:hypothetical protein B4U79_18683 [Dinothrombium tinctorium]|uniref:CCHC-type domain-containing protein n=1 Tax=Dinothrombium tinctorium TaxID=1965070 RepID=A0A3S3ND41_9ACAR|nr:hypothetical protein B4U79_18683 [Dinothrombium tinctorium]
MFKAIPAGFESDEEYEDLYLPGPSKKKKNKNIGKPTVDNCTEIIVPIRFLKHVVGERYSKLQQVQHQTNTKIEFFGGNFGYRYGTIVGSEQNRELAITKLKSGSPHFVEITILPKEHCVFCYSSEHKTVECKKCLNCGAFGHFADKCCKKPENKPTKQSLRRFVEQNLDVDGDKYLENLKKKKSHLMEEAAIKNSYFNYKKQGVAFDLSYGFGLDVEKGECKDKLSAREVVISGRYSFCPTYATAYHCFIKRPEKWTRACGQWNMVDLARAHDPEAITIEEARNDVLHCLRNCTVFVCDGDGDFESLGITPADIQQFNITVVDVAKFSANGKSHQNFNTNKLPLRDLVYFYRGTRFHEYDKKNHPFKYRHSCEVDARNTAKLGALLYLDMHPISSYEEILIKIKTERGLFD